VLYLPGLGEPVEAGHNWRMACARGGYAVVSIQTSKATAQWTTAAARSGDFAKVARDEFSTAALAKRIECLNFVLQGIARRAAKRKAFYTYIDSTRIAVAGFDLGAQTALALALAGESHPGLPRLPAFPALRGVVAMSPHAILVRGGFAERFVMVELPNLSITATEDTDPYGLVDPPYARQAPFKLMPPGDKFLLVLEDGSHQALSGSIPARPSGDQDGEMPGPPSKMGRGGGGPGMAGGRGGRGGMGGMHDAPPNEAMIRRFAAKGLQRQSVIVEHVSLAFLDATAKFGPVAWDWLARNATCWADPLAKLEPK